MRVDRWVLWLVLFCAIPASRAEGHFLFIRILPPAEGGRAAEVYFSELAQAGDPRFVDKIADTRLWLQHAPGTFTPLTVHKAADRLRAWLPASGSLVVAGQCDYGVLARPKQKAFLLRHCPKAISGQPEELNRMKANGKLPLEIVATINENGMHLTALKDGKPLPKAEFIAIDTDLAETKFTADASGRALWKPPATGMYSIYTRDARSEAGTYRSEKYEEIRDFATIAFDWPLARKDADAAAVALFQEAVAARAQWHDFPGFSADLRGNQDGRRFAGAITIDAKGAVTFADADASHEEAVAGWVQQQLESLVLHRLARPATADRVPPVLRFADTDNEHPLGRLLIFDGGRFASSYRIRDRQIMVVNRHMGKENMTITVLENDKNSEGRYLPRSYAVRYWDTQTSRLQRVETVQTGWLRLKQWDLPTDHVVTMASDTGLSVRSFTLAKHQLLAAKPN